MGSRHPEHKTLRNSEALAVNPARSTSKWWETCLSQCHSGLSLSVTSATDKVTRPSRIAWSPDGKYIAFRSEDGKLRLVPVDGGASKVLAEGEGLAGYRSYSGLAWSPDGKELAYTMLGKIWRLGLETGKSEEVQTGLDARHTQLAWSPDGTTLAFSATQGSDPELWLMEGRPGPRDYRVRDFDREF